MPSRESIEKILASSCVIAATLHRGEDYISFQYSVGLALCAIPIAISAAKKLGTLFGIFCGYTTVHSVNGITNFYGKNTHLPMELQNQVSITTAFSFLYAIIIFLCVLLMDKKYRRYLRLSFAAISVINGLYAIHSYYTGFRLPGGYGWTSLLDYCGMSATMTALGLAFILPSTLKISVDLVVRALAVSVAVAGIVLSKSAIPFVVVGVIAAAHLLSINRRRFLAPASMLFAVLLSGYLCVGTKMINSSGRFQAYGVFLRFLKSEKRLLFGTGLGTLKDYAMTAQSRESFMMGERGGWIWDKLHSEVIQLWFEMGIPALVLAVIIYFQCLARLYKVKDYNMMAFGAGLAVALCVNYPLRYFTTSLMAALFLVDSLYREKP